MDQQMLTLIVAIGTFVVSIFHLLLGSHITWRRERRLAIWRKEADSLMELEELAGKLIEEIGSYHDLEIVRQRITLPLEQLEAMSGRLAKYPKIRQSARELHQAVNLLLNARREHKDDREERANLDPTYRALLDACDEVRRSL